MHRISHRCLQRAAKQHHLKLSRNSSSIPLQSDSLLATGSEIPAEVTQYRVRNESEYIKVGTSNMSTKREHEEASRNPSRDGQGSSNDRSSETRLHSRNVGERSRGGAQPTSRQFPNGGHNTRRQFSDNRSENNSQRWRNQAGQGGGRGHSGRSLGVGRGEAYRGRGRGGVGRGRGHGGVGRGRGHGGPRPPVQIVSEDFVGQVHAKCQSSYKVHAPNCNCKKLKTLRAEHGPSSLDGLLVHSTSNFPPAIYVCSDTGNASFLNDMTAAELKLKREIFENHKETNWPIKVSCAMCLLTVNQPNGFACIASSKLEQIKRVVTMARESKLRIIEENRHALHSDHAIDVAAVPWSLFVDEIKAQSPSQKEASQKALRKCLTDQGVSLPAAERLELGHHIHSMVRIIQSKQSTKHRSKEQSMDHPWLRPLDYWFVLLQSENNKDWALDLPGGKRHLGESSFEGMVRETFEECSLHVDDSWKFEAEKQPNGVGLPKDSGVFFILQPPENDKNDDDDDDDKLTKATKQISKLNLDS